jgi:hypothetical protein
VLQQTAAVKRWGLEQKATEFTKAGLALRSRTCCHHGMTSLRLIAAALLFVYFPAAAPSAFAGSAKTGTADGTFVGIEQGDYAHFQIKDKQGHDDSFIILRPHKSVQPYLDHPAQFKGNKVRVHWKEQTIAEAGGLMKTVVKVE